MIPRKKKKNIKKKNLKNNDEKNDLKRLQLSKK